MQPVTCYYYLILSVRRTLWKTTRRKIIVCGHYRELYHCKMGLKIVFSVSDYNNIFPFLCHFSKFLLVALSHKKCIQRLSDYALN